MKDFTPFKVMVVVLLTGCTTSGVVPTGPDSFMAHGHTTYFTVDGAAGALSNATEVAGEYCAKLGKNLVVGSYDTHWVAGAMYTSTVNFECLSKGDAEIARPHLQPIVAGAQPSTIINNQNGGGGNGHSDELTLKMAKARTLLEQAVYAKRKTMTECVPDSPERQTTVKSYWAAQGAAPLMQVAAELPDEAKARETADMITQHAYDALGGFTCHPDWHD